MPYIEEEDDKIQRRLRGTSAQQGVSTTLPGQTVNGMSGNDTTPGAVGGGANAAQSDPNSKFVNFDQYFNNNRQGAVQMATRVGDHAERAAGKAQDAITGAQGALNKGITQGAVRYGGQTVAPSGGWNIRDNSNPAGETVQVGATRDPKTGKPLTTPTGPAAGAAVAPSPTLGPQAPNYITLGDAEAKIKQAGQSHQGLLQGFNRVQQPVDEGMAELNNLKSQGGIQSILKRLYGGSGGYSSGMSRFDGALAGAGSGGRFQQLQKRFGDLDQKLQTAIAEGRDAVTLAEGENRRGASQYQTAIDDFNALPGKRAAALQAGDNASIAAQTSAQATAAAQKRENEKKALVGQGQSPQQADEELDWQEYVAMMGYPSTVSDDYRTNPMVQSEFARWRASGKQKVA
jgi:hypothetical protein